jgi:ABC-type proline/glycine betaine transport system permease subunit
MFTRLHIHCTVMAVLVGLQTTPLNYSQAFIADYIIGITIVLLQTVPTLTVLTIALSVDSRVPRQFPYCTVLLALSIVDSRPSTPWRLAAGCRLI